MRTGLPPRAKRRSFFFLSGLVIMAIAAVPVSGAGQDESIISQLEAARVAKFPPALLVKPRFLREAPISPEAEKAEERLWRQATDAAEKLKSLARKLLGEERLEKELGKDWGETWEETLAASEEIEKVREWGMENNPSPDRNPLKEKLEGDREIRIAREYVSTFPDSHVIFDYIFGFERGYWTEDGRRIEKKPAISIDDGSDFYIRLFFGLYDYVDKREFIRKAVGVTVGVPGLKLLGVSGERSYTIYEALLSRHFQEHLGDYVAHLAHDKEATVALLRYIMIDDAHNEVGFGNVNTGHHDFQHLGVELNTGELCLSNSRTMRLCAAAGIIDIPLLDDIAAVLECDGREGSSCAHAAKGGTFQKKLAGWAKDGIHLLDPAFEPGNKDAVNHVPLFYMVKRYLADEYPEWPLLEAKLYIHHPKLGMRWLSAHSRDFEWAKSLGVNLFFDHDCNKRNKRSAYLAELRRLGDALIGRYREYVRVGENQFGLYEALPTYKVHDPMFQNHHAAIVLLKHWEDADPGDRCRKRRERLQKP